MRVPRLTAIAFVLCLSAPIVAWAGGGPKLPRAIDNPVVRPKLREGHKAMLRGGRHPSKLWSPQWGRDRKWVAGRYSRPMAPYLK